MNTTATSDNNAAYDYGVLMKSIVIKVLFTLDGAVSASVTPAMIVIGLTGNILTLIVLSRTALGTAPTTRIYYCWIAFFDALTIASKDVFFTFLTDGMHFIVRKGNAVGADHDSSILWYLSYAGNLLYCSVVAYFYIVMEMTANLSVVVFILERLLVLTFPFHAPKFFTKRKVLIILGSIFLYAASLSVCTFYWTSITYMLWIVDWPQCNLASVGLVTEFAILQLLCVYSLPAIAYVLVTCWTVVVLRSISAASKKLGRTQSSSVNKKELESLLIAAAMVVVNVAIFIPIGIAFVTLPISCFQAPVDHSLVAYGSAVWQAFYPFAIFPHSVNFFIYCVKVRNFKESVLAVLSCSPVPQKSRN